MIVVSNSSPLITLSKIDHLHLLPSLYEIVHITPEVYSEVSVTGAGLAGAAEVAGGGWIRVEAAELDLRIAEEERAVLGAGEVSTIRLARQLKADLALMDDRQARALARKTGVTPLGCVGVLQTAFLAGIVADLRTAYCLLLGSGAYVDRRIIEASLKILNLPGLDHWPALP